MPISYLFVGDDFTGSSDTLAAIAETGKNVRLYLDPPNAKDVAEGSYDAIGIATDLRSLEPVKIRKRINSLAEFITDVGPQFIHYKVCSTFDSSPTTGSIGTAVIALVANHQPYLTAILGGQPSLKRYNIFGNLFAEDINGDVFRIDRHPVMSIHPSTPMSESDLKLHFEKQGIKNIESLPWPTVENDLGLSERLEYCAEHNMIALLDAACQNHVVAIGRALSSLQTSGAPILIVGASSVPESIFGDADAAHGKNDPSTPMPVSDAKLPCLVIAGSRSKSTATQIDAAIQFEKISISADDLLSVDAIAVLAESCVDKLQLNHNLIAHLNPDEEYGLQGIDLASRLADLTEAILKTVQIGKLAIAGGDTSSVIIRALEFESLDLLRRMTPGVALCSAHSSDPALDNMMLMLKGGQVGGRAIFDNFAAAL